MKRKKFLQTDFIQFLIEHNEGQNLPDDEIEIPAEKNEEPQLIKKPKTYEIQSEDEVDMENDDDEIIEELLNSYKKMKKKYESNRIHNRRKQ